MYKTILIIALLQLSLGYCYGQSGSKYYTVKYHSPKVVKRNENMATLVDNLPPGQTKVTIASILSSPKLKCLQSDCEVIGFMVAFFFDNESADVKKGNLGPYFIYGPDIPDDVLSGFKKCSTCTGKMFITEIVLECDGKLIEPRPIILSFSK